MSLIAPGHVVWADDKDDPAWLQVSRGGIHHRIPMLDMFNDIPECHSIKGLRGKIELARIPTKIDSIGVVLWPHLAQTTACELDLERSDFDPDRIKAFIPGSEYTTAKAASDIENLRTFLQPWSYYLSCVFSKGETNVVLQMS
ncbi:hypothetical protein AY555_10975 (plasmid) [Haematospirillum jordaniae]|uniref:Uncharacterized protein n=1 Tax=Haematospirillum jordaniae TaxID=1549855 RepID=A0A143DGP9_9PROT|nr:hypothetical protein AY555_10975 [Haematospirillum jordaniae]